MRSLAFYERFQQVGQHFKLLNRELLRAFREQGVIGQFLLFGHQGFKRVAKHFAALIESGFDDGFK